MNAIDPRDKQFHIQQARLQTRKPRDGRMVAGRQYAAPPFSSEVESWYDIPAITRKRAIQACVHNQRRIAAYVDRARNLMREAA